METKRLSKRIPFRQKVKFGFPEPRYVGYTSDLSLNGLRLSSNHAMPPGSKVAMRLYLGERSLRLEGDVVWVAPAKGELSSTMGVKLSSRLNDISLVYTQRLNEYRDGPSMRNH